MRIASFDLSLSATGHALWDNGRLLSFSTVRSTFKEMMRLHDIMCQVGDLSRGCDLVVCEDLSFGSNLPGAAERTMLAGLVRHWLWKHEIPLALAAPSALKKFVCGSGKAEKSLVLREVFKRFAADCRNDNEADAVGLVHIGAGLVGEFAATADFQREVLDGLRKKFAAVLDRLGVAA